MNIAQKIVFLIGLLVFVLAGVWTVGNWPNYRSEYVPVNILSQLLIVWIMVIVATAGLIYTFKSKINK
jgi:hypothetical protein